MIHGVQEIEVRFVLVTCCLLVNVPFEHSLGVPVSRLFIVTIVLIG